MQTDKALKMISHWILFFHPDPLFDIFDDKSSRCSIWHSRVMIAHGDKCIIGVRRPCPTSHQPLLQTISGQKRKKERKRLYSIEGADGPQAQTQLKCFIHHVTHISWRQTVTMALGLQTLASRRDMQIFMDPTSPFLAWKRTFLGYLNAGWWAKKVLTVTSNSQDSVQENMSSSLEEIESRPWQG